MKAPVRPQPPQPDPIEVGSFFLETMTTGMYEDPFHCIREYVQNAFDAIQDAIRQGQLGADDGRVLISLGGTARAPSLMVRDNGTGIPASKAYSTLVSLGASRKTPVLHAGFRGIGRLAGIAYSTSLRFTTTAKGEAVATVVEYDCGRIRGYFSPGAEPVDVRDVMRSSVTNSTKPVGEDEHYTEVEMFGLVNLGKEFVELAKLQPYLRTISPVEYSDNFEFADRIRALADSFGASLPAIHIEVKQKKERKPILKPYKNSYPTNRKNVFSKLHNIETFTSVEHGWFGWIGVSNFPGEIVDEMAEGVRFRIKNIQIGDDGIIEGLAEELTAAGSERRLQPWAVGEIFLTNPKVVPNARRDGFEDSAAWRDVRRDIKEQVVRRIIKLVRSASTTRSAMKNLADELDKLTAASAVVVIDQAEKDRIEALIKKNLRTLGDPEKLVGADTKEVSRLTSRFKALAEELAKRVPTTAEEDEPDDDADTGSEAGESEDIDQDGGEEGDDDNAETPPTRKSVILAALNTELAATQAERLSDLVVAKLAEHNL
jgi:molecular chaperone HtpG